MKSFAFILIVLLGLNHSLAIDLDSLEDRLQRDISKIERIETLHELAWYYAGTDNQKSLKFGNQSLYLAQSTSDKELIATSYNRIGLAYDYDSQFEKAIWNYNQCLKIRQEESGPVEISAAYNNIGGAYYYQGNYDKALENYFSALDLRETSESADKKNLLSQSYNNIALVYKAKGKYEKSANYYQKSLQLKRAIRDEVGMCTSLSNMGVLFLEMDKIDSAELSLNEALELAVKNEIDYNVKMIQNNLALLYIRNEQFDRAEEIYLNHIQTVGDADGVQLATAHINLSNVYLQTDRLKQAEAEANTALELGKESGSLVVQQNAYQLLFEANEKLGNTKNALDYMKSLDVIEDSLYNSESDQRFNELLVEFETSKKADSITILNQKNSILSQQNQIADEKVKNRTRIGYLLGFGLLFLGLSLILYVRYARARKKAIIREKDLEAKAFMSELDALRARLESDIIDQPKTNFEVDQTLINDYLMNPLSERELDVLKEVAEGKTNKEIAETLFVSVNTVKTHILNIYVKLDVQNRTQAAVKAGSLRILKNS